MVEAFQARRLGADCQLRATDGYARRDARIGFHVKHKVCGPGRKQFSGAAFFGASAQARDQARYCLR